MGMRPQDMRRLMEQAQAMQRQLASTQEEIASRSFEGTSGGGVVKATVTGSGELVSVEIAPEVIDPADPEMLGDLVVAAVNQALRTAHQELQERLGGVAGGLEGLLGPAPGSPGPLFGPGPGSPDSGGLLG
ncbi:MAG: YbaB/EbfC family nucleoid-associated protein [Acidimicrobiia bacterium]